MPPVITEDYYLELNAVPLATPAWLVTDVWRLFDDMALRGTDLVMPHAAGRRPYPRIMDAQTYTLTLEVFGDVEDDGTLTADAGVGLVQHLDYLRANLGFAESTGDGTVPAIFHRHTEDDLIADVHFLGFRGSELISPAAAIRTTFDISVPMGWTVSP